MLKKGFAILLAVYLLVVAGTCFAEASIKIDKVTLADVKQAIVDMTKDIIPNGEAVDVDENQMVILGNTSAKINNADWFVDFKIHYNMVFKDNGVILSAIGESTETAPNGEKNTYEVPDTEIISGYLDSVKMRLNGSYRFGLDYDEIASKDGVIVKSMSPNSPMIKAGIKVGDIITAINGKPVQYSKPNSAIEVLSFDPNTPATVTFTVKRGVKELNYTITSVFFPPVKASARVDK